MAVYWYWDEVIVYAGMAGPSCQKGGRAATVFLSFLKTYSPVSRMAVYWYWDEAIVPAGMAGPSCQKGGGADSLLID